MEAKWSAGDQKIFHFHKQDIGKPIVKRMRLKANDDLRSLMLEIDA